MKDDKIHKSEALKTNKQTITLIECQNLISLGSGGRGCDLEIFLVKFNCVLKWHIRPTPIEYL